MDRFTLAVVGGVLGLVVAGLVAATLARGHDPSPDLGTPSGVVLAYALAEQRGDAAAAWDLLAGSVQTRNDRDQFLARAGNHGTEREYLATEQEQVDANDGASVVLVGTSASGGGIFGVNTFANRSTVRLTHEPAGWRITVPPDPWVLTAIRP